MVTCFKRFHACSVTLGAPNPAVGHHRLTSLLETSGHSQASLGQSLVGVTAPSFWVLVHKVLSVPSKSLFPVLCKFWQLYGGVNGDLLQKGVCHTQVCSTQIPCPCGRLLPTCTFTGHAQTQFCLNLYGIPGSWCTQGLFEPC